MIKYTFNQSNMAIWVHGFCKKILFDEQKNIDYFFLFLHVVGGLNTAKVWHANCIHLVTLRKCFVWLIVYIDIRHAYVYNIHCICLEREKRFFFEEHKSNDKTMFSFYIQIIHMIFGTSTVYLRLKIFSFWI